MNPKQLEKVIELNKMDKVKKALELAKRMENQRKDVVVVITPDTPF